MNSITRMRMIAAKNSSALPFSRVTRRDYGRAKSSFGAPPTKEEEELPISAASLVHWEAELHGSDRL